MHTLRVFSKADAKGVRDLILSILTQEYPFEKNAYSDSDLDRIDEIYGGKKDSFMVIEDGGDIVGTVGIKEDSGDSALLRRLFVDIKHRKLGYGTELLNKAIEFCREKGYKRIAFRCTDRMKDAMNLCIGKGFKEIEALDVAGFKIHNLEFKI
ncbi:MAG: GNAT family N-acetyltransferase [Candidatus Omnitrophota bacterium]|jgi:N-acetylglutamate synthase-like GNAT family acetyltransferase|nr:GNAT family N-acetyltransferase [Candidatus Omnitrophota bacterium]